MSNKNLKGFEDQARCVSYAYDNTQHQYNEHPPNDDVVPIAAAINAWTLICGCYMGIEQTMKLLIRMRGGVSEKILKNTHNLECLYSLLDPSERDVVAAYYRVYRSLHNFDTGNTALETAEEFIQPVGNGYVAWRYILVEIPETVPKMHLGSMLETWRALEMDWRFHVALVLAHETGHRIGAIRQLRWSDVDLEGGVVRWRAEHDKSGYEHRTPLTAEALAALEEARKRNPVTGHTLVLPSPQDRSRCVGSCQARGWWQKAEGLAGLEPKRGRGWHSLRRKFASDLMDQPLKVLCELGGWKEAKTVLQCYQQVPSGLDLVVIVEVRGSAGRIPAN